MVDHETVWDGQCLAYMLPHMALLQRLRAKAENRSVAEDGRAWGDVYLPNVQGDIPHAGFAGQLSALKKLGVYRPLDRHFGSVLLRD